MAEVWTFETLIVWINARFKALQRAVDKAESADAIRFKGQNEFRATVEDLIKTRVNQDSHDALAARVKRLEDAEIKSGGKVAGLGQLGAIIASSVIAAGAAVAILVAFNGGG